MLQNNQLNSLTADALCTAITLGFLNRDAQRPERSHFVYEGDPSDHETLHRLMSNSKIVALNNLFPVLESQELKREHPFIYARQNDLADIVEQIDIDDFLKLFVGDLERICNDYLGNVRGAYIGGVANREQLKLLFPSLLYQYDIPNYVDQGEPNYTNDVTTFYHSFEDATEKLLDMFSNLIENQTGDEAILFGSTVEKLKEIVNDMPQNINPGRLFASVHGLVTSMTKDAPGTLPDGNYNVELALSEGTNKVGSCMPCSIFATSQGAPASYTHLGRGDYWNLPKDCATDVRNAWEDFVAICYSEGIQLIRDYLSEEWRGFFGELDAELENNNTAYIGKVFLSALTFPGSFVTKMIKTLGKIDEPDVINE